MLVATLILVALSAVFTNVYASCQYIILDVNKVKSKSVEDYKDMLKEVDLVYSFKVVGSSRLLFVVRLNESSFEKFSKINLPGDAISIAVGDLSDKLRTVGVDWKKWDELPDANLTLFERTLKFEGEPTEGAVSHLQAYGEKIKPIVESFPNKGFFPLGRTPFKAYFIFSLSFRCHQVGVGSAFALNYLNGPGDSTTKVEFLTKV
uniref:Major perivitellin subunit 6 n=1 Tax=Pomacea scalaris TaxID=527798 RepID=A0A2U8SZU3_9CAEN|nr:major perivitellin subunit 6 [Pomacea scalaris]